MGSKGRKSRSQKDWGPGLLLPPPSLPWPHLHSSCYFLTDPIDVRHPECSRSLGQF